MFVKEILNLFIGNLTELFSNYQDNKIDEIISEYFNYF